MNLSKSNVHWLQAQIWPLLLLPFSFFMCPNRSTSSRSGQIRLPNKRFHFSVHAHTHLLLHLQALNGSQSRDKERWYSVQERTGGRRPSHIDQAGSIKYTFARHAYCTHTHMHISGVLNTWKGSRVSTDATHRRGGGTAQQQMNEWSETQEEQQYMSSSWYCLHAVLVTVKAEISIVWILEPRRRWYSWASNQRILARSSGGSTLSACPTLLLQLAHFTSLVDSASPPLCDAASWPFLVCTNVTR
jgi:hypothetical protein